ncbi:hypothetical protein NEOLEDRAFT_1145115 [Neolentinus lepideus HHB14362 ss-1]|uniref:Uncharacterized protein n=1 Tax=Neolentinus lepideus HHB14362 ss-1 TaxID=1314782 RepID=A0A165V956_9AGAM|nr:hypothetical protein NEOLEDRAFT_1145115 [Neolentinus lepideus HHB14362 ss-1]
MTHTSSNILHTAPASALPMGTGISSASSKSKADSKSSETKTDGASAKSSGGFSLSKIFKSSKKPVNDGTYSKLADTSSTAGGGKDFSPTDSKSKQNAAKKADIHLNARHMGPGIGRLGPM